AAQQDDHCAATPGVLRRFAISEHIVPLREPTPDLAFQHGLLVGRCEALAMHDPNATVTVRSRVVEKIGERIVRLVDRMSMEVDVALHRPLAAPQLREDVDADAAADVRLPGFVL